MAKRAKRDEEPRRPEPARGGSGSLLAEREGSRERQRLARRSAPPTAPGKGPRRPRERVPAAREERGGPRSRKRCAGLTSPERGQPAGAARPALGLLGLAGGLVIAVAAAWVLFHSRPERGVAASLATPPSVREAAAEPARAHDELGRRLAALRQGVESLPRDPGAREAALLRLERGARALRSERQSPAQARELEGLLAQVELELARSSEAEGAPAPAPRAPSPAAPGSATPAPAPARAAAPASQSAPVPSAAASTPVAPEPTREPTREEQPTLRSELEKRLASLERELGSAELLARVFERHDARDRHGLAAAVAEVEAKAGQGSPEAAAARALRDDLAGRFLDSARALLDPAARKAGGLRAATARVRALFGTMRYEEARAALGELPEREVAVWESLIQGPFAEDYPLAASTCQSLTPDRRYRVITDLGLPAGALPQLEARLRALPEAERKKAQARASKAHRGLSELCDVMDKACRAFGKLLSSDEPPQVFPTVYVLHDRTQFDRFSAALDIHGVENALGYYLPAYRVLVFYDQPEGRIPGRALSRGTFQVLIHETFHQWLHLQIEDAPRWFDEGMAEYFGIGEMTSSGLRYGLVPTLHPSRLDNLREALGGLLTPPMSLRELIRADRETFYGGGAAVYYAQAWSVVHWLGSTPKGQRLLRDYFHALRRGLDQEAAYQEVFAALDLEAMEPDWRQYVGALR